MPDNRITTTLTTLDQTVVVGCEDNPLVGIEVSGTWAGTLTIETNLDPDNPLWRAGKVFTEAGVAAPATITANGRWVVQAAIVGQVRARLNPATSGAVVVTLRAGDNETFGIGSVSSAALLAGFATVGNVGGLSAVVAGAYTRPADTIPYTAGDALANSTSAPAALTFPNAALRSGGSGFVISASLVDKANQTLKLAATLYLFSATVTPTNDNAALAIAAADMDLYLGKLVFSTADVTNSAAGAAGSVVFTGTLAQSLPYRCAGTSLFGLLQVTNAYTPVSGEVFNIILGLSQDA